MLILHVLTGLITIVAVKKQSFFSFSHVCACNLGALTWQEASMSENSEKQSDSYLSSVYVFLVLKGESIIQFQTLRRFL